MGPIQRQLLADFSAMRKTGRKLDPDQERSVGARLAASMPKIIAAAADPKKRRPVRRRGTP